MVNFAPLLVGPGYPSLTNSDRQGCSKPGGILPPVFIFSVSIVTSIASVVHAILLMISPGVLGAIFGTAILVPCLYHMLPRTTSSPCIRFFLMLAGCAEAAVSIMVCSMSVVIPAILRALGVGNPFMREDTVDVDLSAGVDIVRINTTIELGLPIARGTVITDSDESEGPMGSRRRDYVDLNGKDDRKHRLTAQASDGSLGNSKTVKVLSLANEWDITDSLAQARSTPVATTDRDIETDIEEERAKRNST
jgi:hypothetical protein